MRSMDKCLCHASSVRSCFFGSCTVTLLMLDDDNQGRRMRISAGGSESMVVVGRDAARSLDVSWDESVSDAFNRETN
jgi:hypothetical protein